MATKPTSKTVLVLAGLLLLSWPSPSRANTLVAPVVVLADETTGDFSYEAVFTASESLIIASWTLNGPPASNVGGIIIADCFCPPTAPGCPLSINEEQVIFNFGSLIDPSRNGTATVHVDLCDGRQFDVSTIITTSRKKAPAVSEWGIASLGLLLLAGLTIKFRGA